MYNDLFITDNPYQHCKNAVISDSNTNRQQTTIIKIIKFIAVKREIFYQKHLTKWKNVLLLTIRFNQMVKQYG